MIRYEIEVRHNGFFQTNEQERQWMDQIRQYVVADLIEGIDQRKESWLDGAYGEDGLGHTSIFVDAGNVAEAVRRINEAGWATDEDTEEE